MTKPIASPPWTGNGKRIERKIRKALYEYEMVSNVKHLTVALSGGKDSLTLLFMLKAISGRGFPPFQLSAAHIGGDFSCGAGVNTSYLADICDQLEVPFVIKESNQELETLECYSCSRERRKLLFEAAKDFGADTVAFGHHRDDNVQTLLMNLLHKAEFAGNMPIIHMKKYNTTIIRPMIFVTEEEIVCFAKHHQFMRIMCQCPVGQTSMRKKAEELVREIEDFFPDARHNLSRAALMYGSNKALNP
ncbi:MAG: tRNA 2-thiocytidine biosynthesis TtcA family protein [Chlamydiota bacterium]